MQARPCRQPGQSLWHSFKPGLPLCCLEEDLEEEEEDLEAVEEEAEADEGQATERATKTKAEKRRAHVHACIYACIHGGNVHVYLYLCVHVYVHPCVYVCVCICNVHVYL